MKIKKSIYSFFGNMHLYKRLIIYFIALGVIPFVIYGTMSIALSINTIEDSAIQYSLITLDQITIRVDTLIDEATSVSIETANDTIIQNSLRKPLDRDIEKKFETDLTMDTYLNFDASYRNNITDYYILGENSGRYKAPTIPC